MELAESLWWAVSAQQEIRSPHTKEKWAVDFLLFCRESNVTRKQLQRTIREYCMLLLHGLPKYMPVALDARAFCEKYDRIFAALRRIEMDNPKPLELTPKELLLCDIIKETFQTEKFHYSTGLELLVRGLHQYKVGMSPQLHKELAFQTVADHYVYILCSTRTLFRSYALWIVEQVSKWTYWKGDLSAFVPGGKHFQHYIQQHLRLHNLHPSPKAEKILFGVVGTKEKS
jgi:hypothetical protein